MKVVAYATIKLNSQRVPHKNTLMVGGRPLCWHILKTASKVKGIDEIIVYCSDEEVCKYIPSRITFMKREKWLDGDDIRAKDTYTAFINEVYADVYIALCTTSPFIKRESIETALEKVLSGKHDSAFSARRLQTFAWYQGAPINYDPYEVPRTQDMEPVYIETSGFFIFRREVWTEHGRRIGFHPYIQEVDGIEGVDIDTAEDLDFARMIADHVPYIDKEVNK